YGSLCAATRRNEQKEKSCLQEIWMSYDSVRGARGQVTKRRNSETKSGTDWHRRSGRRCSDNGGRSLGPCFSAPLGVPRGMLGWADLTEGTQNHECIVPYLAYLFRRGILPAVNGQLSTVDFHALCKRILFIFFSLFDCEVLKLFSPLLLKLLGHLSEPF